MFAVLSSRFVTSFRPAVPFSRIGSVKAASRDVLLNSDRRLSRLLSTTPSAALIDSLCAGESSTLSSKLLFVTGKGGVGKTTTSR